MQYCIFFYSLTFATNIKFVVFAVNPTSLYFRRLMTRRHFYSYVPHGLRCSNWWWFMDYYKRSILTIFSVGCLVSFPCMFRLNQIRILRQFLGVTIYFIVFVSFSCLSLLYYVLYYVVLHLHYGKILLYKCRLIIFIQSLYEQRITS